MQTFQAPSPKQKLGALNSIGSALFAFGFIGFVLWALWMPLDSAVVAQATVKVSSEKKQLQHLEGGIVKHIYVKEGDLVAQGQLLIQLDETFAGSNHESVKAQLFELELRERVYRAQRDMLEAPDWSDLTHDDATWLLAQQQQAQALFSLSRTALDTQLAALAARKDQLTARIDGYLQESDAKRDEIRYMEEELEAWDNLVQRQFANKLRFLELKRELAELQGESLSLQAQTEAARQEIREVDFELVAAQQRYRETAATALQEVQGRIADLRERIGSTANILQRVMIRAPVAGKVVGMNVFTIGAVIQPGDTLLELVPSDDELVVGAKILPIDIDKVRQNMPARIRMAAYKYHEFPEFNGRVESVSADVFQDPQTLNSYYTARIAIPRQELGEEAWHKISPGMPADVMIVTGESTPAQYLMDPLLSAFRSAWRDS